MEDILLFRLDLAVPSSHPSYLFEEMILAMNAAMFPASPSTLFQKEYRQGS